MAVANNVSDGQLFAKHAELESKKALHFSFHIRRLRIQASTARILHIDHSRAIYYFKHEQSNIPFLRFIEQEGDVPTSALVWHGVEHGQTLNVEFVPRLRGYINACTYRQNGLIKGPIHSSCLFDQDLSTLDKHTTWVVTYDETARSFRIDEEITSEVQHCFS
ncbi:uncharacterized protein EDB93DRAFT_1102451 [Suillus bovinus]|uniref:uncharacterized protein n=1 Tax=Suillus bovinus TaxID=48563 RepID=UPI001B86CA1B|nr:uncharacterized protein EDB93DRAFT_1108253 [Suillus bovinus]XP_041309865.1 uncharacterized protein EDB93DRAFT_1102451 [Suillus bovinus]KAG2130963.1 hypothetical protein EDB93DRAFT_1108253 [Suillus bovinus]KAG2154327.1 hypothetical protein EDB93DRAFT_1102451 [Suillus bovinus]